VTIKKFLLILAGLTVLIFFGMRVARQSTAPAEREGVTSHSDVSDQAAPSNAVSPDADAPTGLQGAPAPIVPIAPVPEHLAPNERRTKWGLVTMPPAQESSH
jgi:hypothetical protein